MIVSEKLQATISHNKLISLGPDTAVSRYKERDILPTRCTRLHHVFSASCVIDTLCTRGRRISLILEVSPCTKDNTHTKRKINHNGLITNGIMMPRHILCLSPARNWISNVLCHGLLNFSVSEGERWEVRGERWFVDIGGIVDHHCLSCILTIYSRCLSLVIRVRQCSVVIQLKPFYIKSLNWLWQLVVTTGVYLSNVYIVLMKSSPLFDFAFFNRNLIPLLSPCFCISIYPPIFRWPYDTNLFNEFTLRLAVSNNENKLD